MVPVQLLRMIVILGWPDGMRRVPGREKEKDSEAFWDRILEKILGKHWR